MVDTIVPNSALIPIDFCSDYPDSSLSLFMSKTPTYWQVNFVGAHWILVSLSALIKTNILSYKDSLRLIIQFIVYIF